MMSANLRKNTLLYIIHYIAATYSTFTNCHINDVMITNAQFYRNKGKSLFIEIIVNMTKLISIYALT